MAEKHTPYKVVALQALMEEGRELVPVPSSG